MTPGLLPASSLTREELIFELQNKQRVIDYLNKQIEDLSARPEVARIGETPRTLAVNLAAGRDDLSWKETAKRYHDLAEQLESELAHMTERWKLQCDDAENARIEQAEAVRSPRGKQ